MDYAKLLLANEIRKEAQAEIQRALKLERGGKELQTLPIKEPRDIAYQILAEIKEYAAHIDSWEKG